jgi:hypothetical protein
MSIKKQKITDLVPDDANFNDVEYGPREWKHSYYLPLDNEMRERLKPLAKPYPKRVTSIDSDAAVFQTDKGGASSTVTLQQYA